jgi:putative DNA primase/helicase
VKQEKNVNGVPLSLPPGPQLVTPESLNTDWKHRLLRAKRSPDGTLGEIRACLANVRVALTSAPEWSGLLRYNASRHQIMCHTSPPWHDRRHPPFPWSDEDNIRAADWLQHKQIMVGPQAVREAAQIVAQERSFHPIRDYLDSISDAWDGEERLDTWLSDYLGVEPTMYSSAVGARFLIGAVARIYQPGVKHDHCLVLEGPQGRQKSTALAVLFSPWFTDDIAKLGSKDSVLQTAGMWCIELAEMARLIREDVDGVKAFIARQFDHIRLPYGHITQDLQRECVFAGTVNKDTYLPDETGNRRFWPVRCGYIDIDSLSLYRDQLWAEAYTQYGVVNHWLDTPELIEAAELEQDERYESGAYDEIIASWLSNKEKVTVSQILLHCIQKPKKEWTRGDQMEVSKALKSLGWVRRRIGKSGKYYYVRWLRAAKMSTNIAQLGYRMEDKASDD